MQHNASNTTIPEIGLWMYRNDGGHVITEKIRSKLEAHGLSVFSDFDMRRCYSLNGRIYTEDGFDLTQLKLLYHMNADEQTQHQEDILRLIQLSGVKVVNSYETFFAAQDKPTANSILRRHGVRVPDALFVGRDFVPEVVQNTFATWKRALIKPRRRHCAKGIVRVNDYEEFVNFFLATSDFTESYYLERYIDFGDHDYRVEIVNYKLMGGYSRQRTHRFKTNIGSDGRMLGLAPQQEQVDLALQAARALNITSTIVNMVRSTEDQMLYVLEVNPILGVFVEEGIRAGEHGAIESHPVYSYDSAKIDAIVSYLVSQTKEQRS